MADVLSTYAPPRARRTANDADLSESTESAPTEEGARATVMPPHEDAKSERGEAAAVSGAHARREHVAAARHAEAVAMRPRDSIRGCSTCGVRQ